MNHASFIDWLKGMAWTFFIVLFLLLCIVACATTEVPKPVVGEVRTVEVRVVVPVTCVNEADLPVRPRTAMPNEPDAGIKRKAAGAVADATEYAAYADQLRAALAACAQRGGKQ